MSESKYVIKDAQNKTVKTGSLTNPNSVYIEGLTPNEKLQKFSEIVYDFDDKMEVFEETITDKDKRDKVKEDAKQKSTEYIDFIFYGKELNGITFDELKDDQKEKIYENCEYGRFLNKIEDLLNYL